MTAPTRVRTRKSGRHGGMTIIRHSEPEIPLQAGRLDEPELESLGFRKKPTLIHKVEIDPLGYSVSIGRHTHVHAHTQTHTYAHTHTG